LSNNMFHVATGTAGRWPNIGNLCTYGNVPILENCMLYSRKHNSSQIRPKKLVLGILYLEVFAQISVHFALFMAIGYWSGLPFIQWQSIGIPALQSRNRMYFRVVGAGSMRLPTKRISFQCAARYGTLFILVCLGQTVYCHCLSCTSYPVINASISYAQITLAIILDSSKCFCNATVYRLIQLIQNF
jgi:hypothetical protein